jgi:hypothetical protein
MTDYLRTAAERINSILNDTDQMFLFHHQEVGEVASFSGGIFENQLDVNPFGTPVYLNLQDNYGSGVFVRSQSATIESAAREFGVNADLVRAVIYTELARGWYDHINPFGSSTILPGNINEMWAALIPGSDINNNADNIRITAKLLSEISERLDDPLPEDIYALYNSMSHDQTYENAETKNTPYFLKQVLESKAWQYEHWALFNKAAPVYCFAPSTPITLADGSCTAIEHIAVGDRILAFDARGVLNPARVTRLFRNVTSEWLEVSFGDRGNSAPLHVTPGHQFLTLKGSFDALEHIIDAQTGTGVGRHLAVRIRNERFQ